MKKIILSLFVLGSITSSNAAEDAEKKPEGDSALGASVDTMTPISLDKESGEPAAKQGGTGEPSADNTGKGDTKDKKKAAKGKEGGRGCTIF